MAKYYYKALKNNKTEVSGYVDAENSRDAREKVRGLGFLPTNINEETFQKPVIKMEPPKITHLSLSEKIFFTSELHIMLSSSIPIIEALETVEEHAHKPKISLLAKDLKEKILKGATFSDAIKNYEKVFGPVYTGLCISGEASGELDKTLNYMVSILKKEDDLKSRVISMSVYPVITVIILIAVFVLCGTFIFPAFINGANISPDEIPMSVKLVTSTCDLMAKYWMITLVLLASGVYALTLIWNNSSIKKYFDKFLLQIPIVCDFVRYVNLSSFFAVMNVAYESGITMVSSLNLSSNTISNSQIKREAELSEKLVTNGELLSQAFVKSELLPPVFNTLIVTGEKSGRLGQMFRDIAIAIDKRLEAVTEALAKAFEPTLTVIIGLVVGYIAVAFFQLYGGMIKAYF